MNFRKLSAILLLLCQAFSAQALASTIYVNINSPSGDGTSWATAFNNLQTALNSAVSGDQIWVAQGTYTPSQGYNVLTGSQVLSPHAETFNIPSGVQVYGGFNGTETSLSERNFKTNLTILSGNLGAGNDSYHVVFFFRVGTTGTQLDGFTISDGMANGISPNNVGGGIYNNGSGSNNVSNPAISNCNLINNSAANGAAIYNNGSSSGNASPSFVDSVFSSNVSTNQGGAVFNNGTSAGNSSPSFTSSLFVNNQASNQGGAVYNDGISGNSSPSFTNVTFYNNSANIGRILYALGNGNTTQTNVILWDTTTSLSLISLLSGATVSISYSDITGGWPGTGNIDADPLFTNESNLTGSDLTWATNDDGLTLQAGSPALATGTSAGAPTTDLIGNSQTTPASMGCYVVSITVAPTTLPNGTVTLAYAQTLTASGGKAPYTFSVTSGTLPAGLTLSTSGNLSGTPTTPGASSFTVTAKDANNATGSQSYTLTIDKVVSPSVPVPLDRWALLLLGVLLGTIGYVRLARM